MIAKTGRKRASVHVIHQFRRSCHPRRRARVCAHRVDRHSGLAVTADFADAPGPQRDARQRASRTAAYAALHNGREPWLYGACVEVVVLDRGTVMLRTAWHA